MTTNEVAALFSQVPWGKTNPKRGVVKDASNPFLYFELAAKLHGLFPVNSSFEMDDLAAFLDREGILTQPPSERFGTVWREYVHERKRHLEKLAKAANHERMREYQVEPFKLKWPRGDHGRARVLPLPTAIAEAPRDLCTLLEGFAKRFKFDFQGIDPASLTPLERDVYEQRYQASHDAVADARQGFERIFRDNSRLLAHLPRLSVTSAKE